MHKTYAHGTRITFLLEKRIEAYAKYVEVSIAEKNLILDRDFLQSSQLCWGAVRKGA